MPREPVDPARIGRRVVRRRAKGMDVGAARRRGNARFDARQDSRHEGLVDDVRGWAEFAEWERLDQLLAAEIHTDMTPGLNSPAALWRRKEPRRPQDPDGRGPSTL